MIELAQPEGLFYTNNEHIDKGDGVTRLIIDSGFPTSRKDHTIRGNTYTGTVEKTFLGGAVEVSQYWNDSPPTAGEWRRGDIVYNKAVQSGGGILGWVCTIPGNPGIWVPIGRLDHVFANHGDADSTLTTGMSFPTNLWRSPLTADRSVTLSTANAYSGAKFRISRTASATGAFSLTIDATGKVLGAGEWCDVEFEGTIWIVTAAGML